jgi:uncharacterized protein YifN (PemK superfamily)
LAKIVSVVVNHDGDERVIQQLAAALRANDKYATQLRDFSDTLENDQRPNGIQFQPKPGTILACHFGLGFEKPEMVKTRPVMVISGHQRVWTRVCVVVPISSKRPLEIRPHHYQLPRGLVPGDKYPEAWVKGDMVIAVGSHRLDRIKTRFRQYVAPVAPAEVLTEVRRCVLHASGMSSLTVHW